MNPKNKEKTRKPSAPKKSRTLMYVQKTSALGARFNDKAGLAKHLHEEFGDAEWAFILHDKDMQEDEFGMPTNVKADDHIHIAFLFKNPRSAMSVSKAMLEPKGENGKFGEQTVEIFEGRSAKGSMFSYLLHLTQDAMEKKKHQYDISEVTANFDYAGFVHRTTMIVRAKSLDIEDITAKIIDGTLIKKDFFRDGEMGTAEEMAKFYSANETALERATKARYALMMAKHGTKGEGDGLEILYVQGDAGSGKTSLAKEYAMKKYGDYFITGSANDAVQDYMGEPVAIFDDARPTDFSSQDWLKLLDPYTNKSTVRSRYYNKYLAVKCIIITTTTPFEDFWLHTKRDSKAPEPIDQFFRRFNLVIKVKSSVEPDGSKILMGDVYEVTECPPFELPRAFEDNGKRVIAGHKLSDQPLGQIKMVHKKRENKKKAQDLLRYFS